MRACVGRARTPPSLAPRPMGVCEALEAPPFIVSHGNKTLRSDLLLSPRDHYLSLTHTHTHTHTDRLWSEKARIRLRSSPGPQAFLTRPARASVGSWSSLVVEPQSLIGISKRSEEREREPMTWEGQLEGNGTSRFDGSDGGNGIHGVLTDN